MQVMPSFDPSAAMNGNIDVSAADSGCKILLYNLSIVAIKINFEDGSTAILHAGEANFWLLDGATPTIEWSQYSVMNASKGPLSMVTVTLYRPGEELEGTYPFSLIYLLSLGNSVPLSTSASSVVNTGNAAGTSVVTGTVLGDGGNALDITNDGHATFGDAMNAGSVTVVGGSVTTPALDLAAGSLSKIFPFQGLNTQTFAHNFGASPTCVLINYAGNFGVAPTQSLAWFIVDSNHITVVGQSGYNYQGIAIHS